MSRDLTNDENIFLARVCDIAEMLRQLADEVEAMPTMVDVNTVDLGYTKINRLIMNAVKKETDVILANTTRVLARDADGQIAHEKRIAG